MTLTTKRAAIIEHIASVIERMTEYRPPGEVPPTHGGLVNASFRGAIQGWSAVLLSDLARLTMELEKEPEVRNERDPNG